MELRCLIQYILVERGIKDDNLRIVRLGAPFPAPFIGKLLDDELESRLNLDVKVLLS